MRAAALRIWVLIALTLVWMLLWGAYSVGNLLGGLVVALVITTLLPLPPVPVQGRVHPLSVLRLVIQVAWYLVLSSFQVAWLAIRPGPSPATAVLRVQLSLKSDLVLVFAVNILTMIPGSLVLEIDQLRRIAYFHVIDVGPSPSFDNFYRQVVAVERLLVAAFERDSEWRQGKERRT